MICDRCGNEVVRQHVTRLECLKHLRSMIHGFNIMYERLGYRHPGLVQMQQENDQIDAECRDEIASLEAANG